MKNRICFNFLNFSELSEALPMNLNILDLGVDFEHSKETVEAHFRWLISRYPWVWKIRGHMQAFLAFFIAFVTAKTKMD